MKKNDTWEFINAYGRAGIKHFVVGYILMVFSILCVTFLPQITQLIIDYIINPVGKSESFFYDLFQPLASSKFTLFLVLVAIFIGLAFLRAISQYGQRLMFYFGGFAVFIVVRADEIKKLTQSREIEDEAETFTNISSGVGLFSDLFSSHFPDIAEYFIMAFLSLMFIFLTDWIIGLVALFTLPIFLIVIFFYFKKTKGLFDDMRNNEIKNNNLLDHYLKGMKEVKTLGCESVVETQLSSATIAEFNSKKKGYSFLNNYVLVLYVLRAFVYSVVVILSGYFAIRGDITVGAFVAIVAYALAFIESLIKAEERFFQMFDSFVAGKRIKEFLNKRNKLVSSKSKEVIREKPNIKFVKISLKIDKKEILYNINFEVPYGKKIGICGDFGSGKSVIIKLMLRILEPTNGGIFVNKTDIKEINLSSLRGQFSYVPQKIYLFNDTIRSNIVLFDENNVDEVKLKKIIKICDLTEFIANKKNKIDEVLFGEGAGVPGQERQKINLARALYRNSPVLLLDSPLEKFDAYNKPKILKRIFKFYKDKTIIISSHYAEDLILCDNIIYLRGNKIVEQGSPKQLLEKDGYFAKAYKKSKEWSGRT